MIRLLILSTALSLLFSTAALAQFTAEDLVPQMTYLGNVTPQEKALGDQLRGRLIRELQYWESKGLPQPKPLEGIFYISSTDHVRLADFLHVLNPTIPDIATHVRAQHEALMNSNLASFLTNVLDKYKKKKADSSSVKNLDVTEKLFDFYAQIRYGYSVKNFYQAVIENKYMGVVDQGLESHAHRDNAFFGEFPKIELTNVLPPHTKDGAASLEDLNSFIDVKALNKESKGSRSRKIIILPRSTQQEGDVDVSTLNDPSVIEHEAGHWFIHGLIGDRPLDTLLDEAGADYMYASSENDPKVGEFFAKASAIVAERLENSNDPDEIKFAKAMKKMSEKNVLRDLSEVTDIDGLDRRYKVVEAHDAGDPIRTFLWQLRSQDKSGKIDQLMVASLRDYSLLPAVISSRSTFVLGFRQVMLQILNFLETLSKTKELEGKPENKGKTAEELQTEASKIISELTDKKEDAAKAVREKSGFFGYSGARPPIKADYVLPEFFRTFYRNAQKQAPELLPLIRSLAEKAMHSESIIVKTKSGVNEIVFVRSNWSKANPVAMIRVSQLIRNLSNSRSQLEASQAKDVGADEPSAETSKMLTLYEARLEKVQEYERTGTTRRLFFPHPVMGAAAKALGLFKGKATSQIGAKLGTPIAHICIEKMAKMAEIKAQAR